MSEENRRTKLFKLDTTISRVAIVVPETVGDEIQLTVGMMKQPFRKDAGGWSMPGGNVQDADINKVLLPTADVGMLSDAQYEAIARSAAAREAKNQIGFLVTPDELNYVDTVKDGPWLTALFYVLRPSRPTVALRNLQARVDGFLWDKLDAFINSFSTAANQGIMLKMIARQLLVEDEDVELRT